RRDKIGKSKNGARPKWAPLFTQYLREVGYRNYHSGKWHIDGKPMKNGFDHSYSLNDHGRFFSPKRHTRDDKPLPPVTEPGFYVTDFIADHAIECLQEHKEEHAEKPFFHFVAFTAPHFPLHALPEDIAKYQGKYDDGWEIMRAKRWERVRELGIVGGELSKVEREVGPPYHFADHLEKLGPDEVNRPLPWKELTESQQKFQAAKMEIHAAMVDRMDQAIGRILAQLKSMGAWENTLVMFLSDNGASAEIMVRDDGHDRSATPGSARSHLCLGPGWSNACNTPFRRHKTWVHRGGCSTPLIMHWPEKIKEGGGLRRSVGHVIDISATILEVAGAKRPAEIDGQPVPKAPGNSLLSLCFGESRHAHKQVWWLHENNRALQAGMLRLVAAKNEPWDLFDLTTDPTESKNLADERPDEVARLAKRWQEQADEIKQLAWPDESP
ncbi:MAG: sulfatase-like hydrolase/transferase, partial [Planctomycetota bacterium]